MSDKRYLESESLKEAMWKNFYKEEDKWECTPEANFLEADGGEPRHWFQLGFSAGLDAVVSADAVPQEMSAREYIKQQFRMCMTQSDGAKCEGCPLSPSVTGEYCDTYEVLHPDKAVVIVEKWAKEHPERRSE